MVALAQQHYPGVPLPEIALYVATELSEPDLLKDLAKVEFKKAKHFEDFLAGQWKSGLAAIHFGSDRADASEVLYEPIIRECLSDGESKALAELFENPGAEQCCERYLRGIAPDMPM